MVECKVRGCDRPVRGDLDVCRQHLIKQLEHDGKTAEREAAAEQKADEAKKSAARKAGRPVRRKSTSVGSAAAAEADAVRVVSDASLDVSHVPADIGDFADAPADGTVQNPRTHPHT